MSPNFEFFSLKNRNEFLKYEFSWITHWMNAFLLLKRVLTFNFFKSYFICSVCLNRLSFTHLNSQFYVLYEFSVSLSVAYIIPRNTLFDNSRMILHNRITSRVMTCFETSTSTIGCSMRLSYFDSLHVRWMCTHTIHHIVVINIVESIRGLMWVVRCICPFHILSHNTFRKFVAHSIISFHIMMMLFWYNKKVFSSTLKNLRLKRKVVYLIRIWSFKCTLFLRFIDITASPE